MSTLLLRSGDLRAVEAAFRSVAPPLMERAGRAAADHAETLLHRQVHADGSILLLAGPGNNGGDAYVCARHLAARGHRIMVLSPAPAATLPPDAEAARAAWLDSGGRIAADWSAVDDASLDLAIDGLFGIGIGRAIDGQLGEWVARFNSLPCPRLALDVPSGLDADTGIVHGIAVRADETLTFIADKPGLHTQEGPDHAGRVHCASLDLPPITSRNAGVLIAAPEDLPAVFVPRAHNSHKGDYGHAAIIGGASGMVGAALLAGRAALYLGAGRVSVGLLEAMRVDPQQPELMLKAPAAAIAAADVIGIGPGLGQTPQALECLRAAIAREVPLAIDADALNLIAAHPVLATHLARRTAATVITPHPAEAARLAGCDTATIQADRIGQAQQLAVRLNAVVVLKGCGTVIAAPDGSWAINASGNSGLASGGSGDCLLGMLVAILGKKVDAALAARAAVFVHGAAADALVDAGTGPAGLTASELAPAARQLANQWAAATAR